MRRHTYVDSTSRNGSKCRRLIATALYRSTLGLTALGASVSHHALAQSLASTDPASWRTTEYRADWGLEAIHAADAYAAGYTGLGVTVGVVDSGIYNAHPEFADGRVKPVTLTGTFGSSGFYLMDVYGRPQANSPSWNTFTKGQPYTVPGTYNPVYNDPHGTHVSGTIAASRDGVGMHGVAFDAKVYVADTATIDFTRHGFNIDYSYFKNAYESVALTGARAINTSWGDPPLQDNYNTTAGMMRAYATFAGGKSLLDAMDEVTQRYNVIQVVIAGNTSFTNSDIRASLPYFRPALESRWLAVGALQQSDRNKYDPNSLSIAWYSNKAGVDKYWYVVAPGSGITSATPPYTQGAAWNPSQWGVNARHQTGYTTVSGTSMAAPHATGALAVIMQRYPYMTNQQNRDVLLTTAYHRNAVDGVADANPNAPNAIWGWGVIDLNKAMKGPGQFLGPVAANLPTGTSDTWSNDISEDALIQRKQENDAEAAAWPARKAAMDPKLTLPALQASLPETWSALVGVVEAFRSGSLPAILDALKASDASPVGSKVVTAFVETNGIGWAWPLSDPNLAYARVNIGNRLARYIVGLSRADFTKVAAGIATDWQTEVQVETTRVASFASIPTRGSLIKRGGGTLTLTGTNTYSGGTTLAGGTLSVARDASLGAAAAPLSFDGGVLQVTGTGFTATSRPITWANGGGGLDIADPANTFTLTQSLTGAGGLAKLGAGTLALSGTNTYAGATTIAAGTLLARGGQAIGDRSAVLIGAGATLALADGETVGSLAGQGRVALGSARLTAGGDGSSTTFAGTLDGTGGLTKAGAGTLTLAGANSYTGGTTIAAGTLQVGAGGTTGSLVGDVANAGTLAFDRADAVTFAGTVSGTGDLVQRGAGTLTLTGAHSFTGLTTVAAGGLNLTASASLVSPVVTLAGTTLTHAGSLTGGLTNAGSALTSGTIAGGITNTGSLTATGGTLDGAIRNAGQLAVTGPVSSDAGFANAAGASLTISGRYALAGGLDNAGTVAIADGGRLVAGRVANAGLLTVAAQASVVDDLLNTGRLVNAGAYTADAVNAPGGTLINTGRFTTVSAPFANAGTLVTTGSLTGGLTNTGAVQAAGVLAGPVSNAPGAVIALTGPTTGITRLANDGAFDLGGTALTVGSLAGTTATATLGNGRLTVGTDGSASDYAGQIVDGGSPTSLTKVGAGTLTLSGLNTLSGPISVLGGDLAVTGALPNAALTVGSGSRLTGDGWFGSLSLGAGSLLSPGTGSSPLGRITVAGSLTLAPGSVYRVDATADGRADRVAVGGSATVAGARVEAVAGAGAWAPRTRYTILSAAGGVQGRFAGVSSSFAFLTPFLGYEPNAVTLTLARNDLDFAAVAHTRNQRAAAAAVQAGAVGSTLYDAVATLSAPQARAAFAGLAGDGHAGLASTAFAVAGLSREAVFDRLRWGASEARDYGALPAAYTADRPGEPVEPVAVPARVFDPRVVSLWGQGLGSLGHVRADANAAALSRRSAGFVMGVDARLDALGLGGLRLGVVGGHVETDLASPGQVQTGTLASTFGGIYGSLEAGPAVVRFGALAADEPARLRRVVAFPGLTDTPSARTGGRSVQGFGEAGYRMALGAGTVLEPFVGAGAVALGRDRFAEQGGAAALMGAARASLLPSATAGVRAEGQLDPEAALPVSVHALAGYRRTFGDVVPSAVLAFRGTGARFVSAGLPIDRDALVAEAGLSVLLTPAASLGVSYTGQIGARAQDHAAKGAFTVRF
ncbi:S8 family serine peptidase [Methylobacterium sp. WL64]|uniref:autotransporter domain-containing protein n=1 Tax=Methylobacterium sp. WL64 TaxID=2603894 RepID=UPI0011CA6CB3|nr:autotransporter domain-containing protein [Methylobacterium sp. WL64]TXN01641.1 S8 family serine peptidase [Methylobacterium sp. WL64]